MASFGIKRMALAAALLAGSALAAPVFAQTVHVGVVISQTGPAAALGIPQRNSIALLPTEIAGTKVQWDVLDDGTDPSKAVAAMRKLIDENNADVILGSSVTPSSAAMSGVAAEKKVPLISMAASASLIQPMDATKFWVFKTPQNDALMADALALTLREAAGFAGEDVGDAGGGGEFEQLAGPSAITGV